MDNSDNGRDSPLSITSNITGILTFLVAIAAAVYVRITYLRNSDDEYFRVKASLSWYKTESAWLADLLRVLDAQHGHDISRGRKTEFQMYTFVMDDLLNLERRLLDLVEDIEAKSTADGGGGSGGVGNGGDTWTLMPRSWQGARPSVAMAWLSVRTKAMELVRQREALTGRVQFLQMSLLSSRINDLEARLKWQDVLMDTLPQKMNGSH